MSTHRIWLIPETESEAQARTRRRRQRRMHACAVAIVLLCAIVPITTTGYLIYQLGRAGGCGAADAGRTHPAADRRSVV